MTLSGPFIDDVAPPARKATWFAWLMLFPSLGTAGGDDPSPNMRKPMSRMS